MSLHDFLAILQKAAITTKVATIYAILEAKAAPAIPHLYKLINKMVNYLLVS